MRYCRRCDDAVDGVRWPRKRRRSPGAGVAARGGAGVGAGGGAGVARASGDRARATSVNRTTADGGGRCRPRHRRSRRPS